jgi:hypothetical protein
MSFQVILRTWAAKEMNNLELIHTVLPSEIAGLIAWVVWPRDAKASASSDASASSYSFSEDVFILAVIKPELKILHQRDGLIPISAIV